MSCNRKALFMFLIVVEFFCPKILHHKKSCGCCFSLVFPCPGGVGGFCQSVNRTAASSFFAAQVTSPCHQVLKRLFDWTRPLPLQRPPDSESTWLRVSKEKLGASWWIQLFQEENSSKSRKPHCHLRVFLTKLDFVLRIYPFLATRILVGWQKMIQRLNILNDDRQ